MLLRPPEPDTVISSQNYTSSRLLTRAQSSAHLRNEGVTMSHSSAGNQTRASAFLSAEIYSGLAMTITLGTAQDTASWPRQ